MTSRRNFFKSVISFIGIAAIAPSVFAEEKRRAKPAGDDAKSAELPLVEPGKDMAANLGYMHNSNQKDKRCSNCVLFTKPSKLKGEEVGQCALFTGKLVKATGYCNSWAKKV